VGPYVRNEEEIRNLASKNIRAVLSLQSKQDMVRYGVEWHNLCEIYKRRGIKAINVEILDRRNQDFVAKC